METFNTTIPRPEIIVFDVYGTLLDMADLERRINLLLDSKRGYTIWFELFMEYCFANNSLDSFHDFFSIAKATLQMTGHKIGRPLSDVETNDALVLLQHLPVYEEVQSCLSELLDSDYRIITLTNAPANLVRDRMERTGLVSYFEEVLSSETVKKYKPEKKVYEWAAQKMNCTTTEILMVTVHPWDIAGAANAGLKTAFLKKGRQLLYPLSPSPDIISNNIPGLVSILKKLE
jgi:2-haloacid dehalogenase